MKIGFGYDSHRFSKGRKLVLGGVEIPWEMGFIAHSDGDVLIHSLIDALLGASGQGNIGLRYPDSDEKYKDISSLKLLEDTFVFLENEYRIVNIDSTIILEKPKINPFLEQMKKNISKILNISNNSINIKGKTSEGMGLVGKGEGAAVFTVVLLERVS
ncbi:2-C-methyl-D-erythritol 2,4-cyclodiphosphate synthase [candidate division KSB1 bacterium]